MVAGLSWRPPGASHVWTAPQSEGSKISEAGKESSFPRPGGNGRVGRPADQALEEGVRMPVLMPLDPKGQMAVCLHWTNKELFVSVSSVQ